MTDHAEEQEMEAEALAAIFDTHFLAESTEPPLQWSIEIYPETGDPSELDELNHVACLLKVKLPSDYPESLPEMSVEIIKGLAEEHKTVLVNLAQEEAEANQGVPSIFAVAERLREWLVENNTKGLDDISMHAQMMRKKKEEEKAQQRTETFESQKQQEKMTEAEAEELAIRQRRAEGTPCNKENFLAWKERFEREMAQKKEEEEDRDDSKNPKKKGKDNVDKSSRLTGYEFFSSKATNLEALEAAAEAAENDEMEDVDEELFEDDVDLDDLDFDSDEEDEEEEEEVDI